MFTAQEPDALFDVFAHRFELPVVVPLVPYESMKDIRGTGLFAGDFDLWFFGRVKGRETPHGIAFEPEPMPAALGELERRGIAYEGPVRFDHGKRSDVGSDGLVAVTEDVTFLPGFFEIGGVWLAEYRFNDRLSRAESRRSWRSILEASGGGPLCITSGAEIVVGARDRRRSIAMWKRLLDPIAPVSDGHWRFGRGASVRIQTSGRDELVRVVFRTASLERASDFLAQHRLLGDRFEEQVGIRRDAVGGLDIRLAS